MLKNWFVLCLVGVLVFGICTAIQADERHFGYSYEADVLPKGNIEIEQWATSRLQRKDLPDFSLMDLRQEIEIGLLDRLTTSLYLNTRNGAFDTVSNEWKYLLLSPNSSPIGVVLYLEGEFSKTETEWEEKLILQSNLSKNLKLVSNIAIKQAVEVEDGTEAREGALELTGGLSYQFTPNWSAALELRNCRLFPDFKTQEYSAIFFGPTLAYSTSDWWMTLSILPQLTSVLGDHEKLEIRFLTGFLF